MKPFNHIYQVEYHLKIFFIIPRFIINNKPTPFALNLNLLRMYTFIIYTLTYVSDMSENKSPFKIQ